MKVFISWSGERSEALAKALREWFPLVLHYVEPWLSKSDIQAGERWNVEIAKGLESCNFGVLCITKENVNSPWILFEAGALAKSMQDGRVIPLLLDLDFKEVSGPLVQFQAKKVEKNQVRELIYGLNKDAPAPVQDHQLEQLFDALWSKFETQIQAIPRSTAPGKHSRPQGEILEELVSSVRNVEMRVRDVVDDAPVTPRRRRQRFHSKIWMDLAMSVSDGPQNPIVPLVLASQFHDDMPWIYELAAEFYRSYKAGRRNEAAEAYRQFLKAVEVLERGPFSEIFEIDPRTFSFLVANRFQYDEPLNMNRGSVVMNTDGLAKSRTISKDKNV
jgi:hypothetical protein